MTFLNKENTIGVTDLLSQLSKSNETLYSDDVDDHYVSAKLITQSTQDLYGPSDEKLIDYSFEKIWEKAASKYIYQRNNIDLNKVQYFDSDKYTSFPVSNIERAASQVFAKQKTCVVGESVVLDPHSKTKVIQNRITKTTVPTKISIIEIEPDVIEARIISNRQTKQALNRRNFSTDLAGNQIPISVLNDMINDVNNIKKSQEIATKQSDIPIAPPLPFTEEDKIAIFGNIEKKKQTVSLRDINKKMFPKVFKTSFGHTPETVARRFEISQYLKDSVVSEEKFSDVTRVFAPETPPKEEEWIWPPGICTIISSSSIRFYKDPPRYVPSYSWYNKPKTIDVNTPIKFGNSTAYAGNSIYIYEKYVPIGVSLKGPKDVEVNISWQTAEDVQCPFLKEKKFSIREDVGLNNRMKLTLVKTRCKWRYASFDAKKPNAHDQRPVIRQVAPCFNTFSMIKIFKSNE